MSYLLLSRLLRGSVLLSLTLLWSGELLRVGSLTCLGLLVLALGPALGLLIASSILWREGRKRYSLLAIVDFAAILTILIFNSRELIGLLLPH
mgnify:CR=1 FL=1